MSDRHKKAASVITTVAALLLRFYDETGRRYDRPLMIRYYGVRIVLGIHPIPSRRYPA